MKPKIHSLLLTGLFTLLLAETIFSSENLPSPFAVIPQPKNVILLKGSGLEPAKLQSMALKGDFSRPVMGELLSQLPAGKAGNSGTLTLILDKSTASLPSEEGYILTVTRDKAEITAKGEAGLFYGCQTLEQLLEDARDYKKPVPACKITDYPVLSYRAVHFDVKHHLDHMNYYYESIDRLARYKINAVVFEFEDKLRFQRQPLVGAPQSISMDEMAALTHYARDRHIEITPLVQGLGHATFILKHQQYAHLRELSWNKWAFCPLHEGTYQVLFDLYRDAIEATPGSKYLHIGGDEIGNIGLCPRCKPMADKEGMLSLSLYWLKRVCEFAAENNRIPIFWDDMPLKEAGVYETTYSDDVTAEEATKRWADGKPKLDVMVEGFPKNCVYMRWNYSMARQPGNILALDWYKSRGLPPLADQEKVQFDYTTKLIELPDLNSPGTWTRKYNDRLEKARVETDNYNAQSQRLQELYNASKRNRYYWELSMALYDLQITAPRLLLALQQWDNADKGQQKAGIEQVKLAVQGFQLAWENLKQVYGKTRFVAYPANYVPDRYFHFASQREDLSWMIQAEELYHAMIEKWLQGQPN